jgi:uncharacterized protein DUF6755
MEPQRFPPERRGLTAIDGALALIAVLLIVQMWLLTATLESFLAGHPEAALPAALVSGLLLLACLGLFLFIRGVDREVRTLGPGRPLR